MGRSSRRRLHRIGPSPAVARRKRRRRRPAAGLQHALMRCGTRPATADCGTCGRAEGSRHLTDALTRRSVRSKTPLLARRCNHGGAPRPGSGRGATFRALAELDHDHRPIRRPPRSPTFVRRRRGRAGPAARTRSVRSDDCPFIFPALPELLNDTIVDIGHEALGAGTGWRQPCRWRRRQQGWLSAERDDGNIYRGLLAWRRAPRQSSPPIGRRRGAGRTPSPDRGLGSPQRRRPGTCATPVRQQPPRP